MARKATHDQPPKRARTYQESLDNRDDPNARDARKAIETLTSKFGIEEIEIKMRIEMFRACECLGTGRRWSERFTITRGRASRLARQLRKDADELRQAIAPQFKLPIAYRSSISADLICGWVEQAAALIEVSLAETDDRNPAWTFGAKRELTQYIWRAAGKPLDRQVSELIAAILGCEYTYEDQRKFRQRNCHFHGTDSIFSAPTRPDNINAKND